jgi:integrase/recombinase XerD
MPACIVLQGMGDLSLYWTPNEFTISGDPWPELPVLVHSETMRIEYIPTEFLIYQAAVVGKARSQQTRYAQAHIVLPFLNSLSDKGVDWRNVTEEQLAYYRNTLENRRAGRKKRRLGRRHIRRVMSFICKFYEWAHRHGHVSALPFTDEAVVTEGRGFLAHLGPKVTSRPVLVPNVPSDQRLPRFFTLDDQQRILEVLDERDRLIVEWALYTGAREHEICNLLRSNIPPETAYRSRRRYPLTIVRKRNKIGELYVPTWLLDKTYQYATLFGRRKIVRATAKRGKLVPENIFLGRWGTALKPDSVYNNFKDTLEDLGLTGTFHDLRHTYAICTLDALMKVEANRRDGGRNALLELKHRMGHDSLKSTEKYLRAREFYLTDIDSELWDISIAR